MPETKVRKYHVPAPRRLATWQDFSHNDWVHDLQAAVDQPGTIQPVRTCTSVRNARASCANICSGQITNRPNGRFLIIQRDAALYAIYLGASKTPDYHFQVLA